METVLKGIDQPQRGDKAFVGAYVPAESKQRLAALANKGGITMTQLLCSMIDRADAIVVAMMTLPSKQAEE
jgi:hypothetical protein